MSKYVMIALPYLTSSSNLFLQDPDIVNVAPQIMDIITQRLGKLYMGIAEHDPHNPLLRRIPPLTRWATDLKGRAEASQTGS